MPAVGLRIMNWPARMSFEYLFDCGMTLALLAKRASEASVEPLLQEQTLCPSS